MPTLRQAAPRIHARLQDSAHVQHVYPALPVTVPESRRLLTSALDAWGLGDMFGDAALAEAELVANAVRAGEFVSPAEVLVQIVDAPGVVLILAGDHNPAGPPQPGQASRDGEHGRGLAIVGALAVDGPAWFQEGDWKIVWCALRKPARPVEPPESSVRPVRQESIGRAA